MDQQVIAYTNQNPEKKYTARIVLISKDFAADRSVLIHCHFRIMNHIYCQVRL